MASDFAAANEFVVNAPPHDQQTATSSDDAGMYYRPGIYGLGRCCGRSEERRVGKECA